MRLPQRKSPRRKEYDYSLAGGYFVTIVTKDREHYFGEIVGGRRDALLGRPQEMQLNNLGKFCDDQIRLLSERRRTVQIHEYVIMPNHVHMLLLLHTFLPEMNKPIMDFRGIKTPNDIDEYIQIGGRPKRASLPVNNPNYKGPTLGSIINMFKGSIVKYANQNNIPFARQPRYHDHIIRNNHEYERIKYYIQTNQQNRKEDKFH